MSNDQNFATTPWCRQELPRLEIKLEYNVTYILSILYN